MNVFRSEDHIERWLGGRTSGATTTITQLAALAQAWWSDRLDPTWRPHSREQNQSLLDRAGLSGGFWQLP
jgi:hypothetical protein